MRSLLAVCAHPDDESFGLGAALHAFAQGGTRVSLLCFTHGEASTLGAGLPAGALHELRSSELAAAAGVLGLHGVELLDHADGALSSVPLGALAGSVARAAEAAGAELILVFDEGGVTGHPDHVRATEAALAAAGGRPVLAWAVAQDVATILNRELGTRFVGRDAASLDLTVTVDRTVQLRAIACHASQATDNTVLRRRLELLGDRESFRWLRAPSTAPAVGSVDLVRGTP